MTAHERTRAVASQEFHTAVSSKACSLITVFAFVVLVFAAITRLMVADDLPRESEFDYDPPVPGSYALPVVKLAADGVLLDTNNKAVKLRDLTHGRITVLSFIYTRCAAPKACPYATGVLGRLHDMTAKDEVLAKNMRL